MLRSHRISARGALMRHAHEFFDQELTGLARLADATVRPPEKGEKVPGRRQLDKEEVIIDFGQYSLVISGPEVVKPLGKLTLFDRTAPTAATHEGPIDSATWSRFGQIVRSRPFEKPRKELPHGEDGQPER
jgi:hypothetical protein